MMGTDPFYGSESPNPTPLPIMILPITDDRSYSYYLDNNN